MPKVTSTPKPAQNPVMEINLKRPFKKLPGQVDFLHEDWRDMEFLLEKIKKLAASFGFVRVEPPLLESAEVVNAFHKKAGEPLLYKLPNGQDVSLRTGVLGGLLRMYIESHTPEKELLSKWYYLSPVVLQHQNPHQLVTGLEYGFEVIGEENAIFDAQILALAWKLYASLGQDRVVLEIGSRGCESCFPEYQQTLSRALADAKYSLCKDCAMTLAKNPARVLACEQPECQAIAADVPAFIDYLDSACASHLTSVLEALDELQVPYVLSQTSTEDEYAKRTFFKFKFNHPQDSFVLSRGSRHDGLFGKLGMPPRPALGLSGNFEVMLRAWRLAGGQPETVRRADVAFIPLGDLGAKKALGLFSYFWDQGVAVVTLCDEHNLKARLQQAADLKVPIALMVGQKEALEGTVILRDVKSGMQEVFPSERILSEVKKRLGE